DPRALFRQVQRALGKLTAAFRHAGSLNQKLSIIPLLIEAFRSRSPGDALRLIRREDPDSLVTRVQLTGAIARGYFPLYSSQEWIDLEERGSRFWEESRASCIAPVETGV